MGKLEWNDTLQMFRGGTLALCTEPDPESRWIAYLIR
jgi:hypothetical protein